MLRDVVKLNFLLGDMSRAATWVVSRCTKFELDTTSRYRVRTTTIFYWLNSLKSQFLSFLGIKWVKFQI